jgi:hypothetical protein
MILTPAAPKAGPTGGDGFAAPPRTCNLTTLSSSFAIFKFKIVRCSYFLKPKNKRFI